MPKNRRSTATKPKAVKVYLTDAEKQTVSERAGELSTSEYLRRAGLGKRSLPPPAPEINRLSYLVLAEISESLQQIAIALSQSQLELTAVFACPDLASIELLRKQIEQVRWQLIAPDAELP